VQALTRVASAVIIFATDLLKTIILCIAYLFSGNFQQLILVIWDFAVSIFTNVILPLLEAIGGFILGFVCLCNIWNGLFGDVFTCSNFMWCGSK
jgi:hypothetical protein